MKKILLSLAIAAGFTASAQVATNSSIAGNVPTDGNTGFVYSFNNTVDLSQSVLNCIEGSVYNTFGTGAGVFSVDSITATNNGFLRVTHQGNTDGNANLGANRFPLGNCNTIQGTADAINVTANKTITARVRATSDVTIALFASSLDGGQWATHDGENFSTQAVAGDAQWTEVEFMITDTGSAGNGTTDALIGFEIYVIGAADAGEIHFDYIAFGDAVSPNVTTQEVVVNGFNVYPNPAIDVVNVKFDATSTSTVELMDVTGKIVESVVAQAGAVSTSFATANINAGVYFVNVRNANGSTTQRVIVK